MYKLYFKCCITFIVLLLQQVVTLAALEPKWWKLLHYKGTSGTYQYFLNYLEPRQKHLVRRQPEILPILSQALRGAVYHCQVKFQNKPWNCSTNDDIRLPLFGNITNNGFKETALLYAMISASTVKTVAVACANGKLNHCSCDTTRHGRLDADKNWYWGGCSHNIRYAKGFARRFLDVEQGNDLRRFMNSHNNVAGRAHVKGSKTKCVCTGTSGSCIRRTCFTLVEPMSFITDRLVRRFKRATKLLSVNDGKNVSRYKRRCRKTRKDLVYLEETPDFCKATNRAANKGRKCHKPTLCKEICCKGYEKNWQLTKENCNCTIGVKKTSVDVNCKTCLHRHEVFVCT